MINSNERKYHFIVNFSFVGIFFLIVFGAIYLFRGQLLFGTIELVLAVCAVINLLVLRLRNDTQKAGQILIGLCLMLLVFLIYSGGFDGTGYLWCYTFPILAFFIGGKRSGVYWMVATYVCITLLSVLAIFGYIVLPYSYTEIRQLVLSLLAVSLLIFFYETIQEQFELTNQSQNERLMQINNEILMQYEHMKQEEEMLGLKTQQLEDAKKAMLNIMEDMDKDKQQLISTLDKSEKLAAAVENTSDAVVITNTQGIISYVNKSVYLATQFSELECIGKKPGDLWGGNMGKGFYEKMWHTLSFEKKYFSSIFHNKKKSGEPYFAEITITPILNPKNEVVSYVGVQRDISERVVNEQRLGQLAAIVESTDDPIYSIDLRGNVRNWNHGAEKYFGYSISEMVGQNIKLIIPEEKRSEYETIIKDLISGKMIIRLKTAQLRKDGQSVQVSLTISPIYDAEKKVVGGSIIARDITKDVEVDRMKTEFISLASHQLRTPLSAMKWFSEMLRSGDAGELTKEQMEMVTNIYESNQRMIVLVNTLLNISRIESGRLVIDPVPTNIGKLVGEIVEEMQPQLTEKNQHVLVSINDQLPLINLDPKVIREVFTNLLSNANKYSPSGAKITIVITKNDTHIICQISDQGYGIPQNEQARIFQKFFRGSNISQLETDGTGLGLYLTKAIVETSGGKIWYESIKDKGTTFWFSLPLQGSKKHEGVVTLS